MLLRKSHRLLALSLVSAVGVVGISGLASPALAAATTVTPPWQPGTSTTGQGGDPSNVGTLTFYNATGQQIVSGSTTVPVAAFIRANGLAFKTKGTKVNSSATMVYSTPNSTSNPGAWNQQGTSGVTADPDTSAPAPINGFTDPVVATSSSTDPSINTYIANFPDPDNGADSSGNPTDSTGYDNVYEVRVSDTGTAGLDTKYDSADIQVNPVTNTWTLVYPAAPAPASTTTAVTTSPMSPQPSGTSVTLSAQVTATPAASSAGTGGTVQFFEDGSSTPLNATPAPVNSSGVASYSTTALTTGTHTITASFVPASGTLFTGSTAPGVSYTIGSTDATSTANVTISPSTVTAGSSQTFTTSVTDTTNTGTTPSGTVTFSDPTYMTIGSVSVGSGGVASVTATLPAGTYSVSATFSPTDTSAFGTSSSTTPTADTVTALPKTSTTLAVDPPATAVIGTTVTLTSTTTPVVAGTVVFMDGATQIGTTQTVAAGSSGMAMVSTSTLSAGSHSLTATFAPSDPTAYSGSESTPTSYTITLMPTATTIAVSPMSPQQAGAAVTLTSTTTESPTVAGSVQFMDGTVSLGASQVVSASGTASITTTTLTPGSHSLSAVFTPSDATYATSSASTTYVITAIPSATTLGVSPASPQVAGSTETLTSTTSPAGAGTVTFFDGAMPIASATVGTTGQATASVVLSSGTHTLTASFAPASSSSVGASSSSAISDTVSSPVITAPTQVTPTLVAKVLSSKLVYGHKGLVQVTVVGGSKFATGTIFVADGGKIIAFGILANGSTIFTLPGNLSAVKHTFTAEYAGDANFTAALANFTGTVSKGATTLALHVSSGQVPAGGKEHVTALLRGDGFTAQGKVEIIIGHKVVASGNYQHGYVNIVLPAMKAGSYEVYAQYVGSSVANPAASSSHKFDVL